MASVNYQGLESHKTQHKHLRAQLDEHVATFKRDHKLDPKFFDFLKFWLSSHIRGVDMKYAAVAKAS